MPSYKKVAVASTFSPRFEQVLAEAKRMRDRFEAELSLIYVGKQTSDVAEKFSSALEKLSLPADCKVYYEHGDPASAILRAINENGIELIVAGALEKQVVLHRFLGNVARRLLRETASSVILFTNPQLEPVPLRKIVFVADYSEHCVEALRRTLHLAEKENCERLYVIRVITTFDEARASRETDEPDETVDEEEKIEQFVLSLGEIRVPTEARLIRGNTGFAAADFVHSIAADLLVVPVSQEENNGRLPGNLEWLTDVIPCNLWVIR